MISLVQIKDGIAKNTDKNKKADRANAASQALWFKRLCLSFSSFLSTCELMNFLLSHCRLLVDYLSYGFMDARRHWACSTQHLLCMSRLSVMSVFQRGSISIHISTETSAVWVDIRGFQQYRAHLHISFQACLNKISVTFSMFWTCRNSSSNTPWRASYPCHL